MADNNDSDNAKIWKVTRACCTSGLCVDCHTHGRMGKPARIVHADNLTKEMADRMVQGWANYAAKREPM